MSATDNISASRLQATRPDLVSEQAPGPPDGSSALDAAASTPRQSTLKTRPRVVIADDEPMIRMMLRRMCGRNADVIEAESGLDVVDMLGAGADFDVLFCDLMMPKMTGMEVFEWLREHRPEMLRRTAFVTGGVFTKEGQEFMHTCPCPILDKPFSRAAVLELLHLFASR